MANTRGKKKATVTKAQSATPKIVGVRAEFAVVLAVITFISGFIIGRVSQNVSLSRPDRELSVEPVQSQGLMDNPTISNDDFISELQKQANESANDPATWTKLGNAYFDTEQYDNAIVAYEKSLSIAPGNPDVLTDLGIMYRRTGNSQRAIELFEEAGQADPNHIMSRFNRGVVMLHDFENAEGAATAWKEVIAIDPTYVSPTGAPVSEMIKALGGE